MKYVEAGGLQLSVIGLGTWQFGAGEWGYGSTYAETVAPAIVGRCLDLGVTLIDTAEAYAFGRSERIVGAALAGRRDEAVVATKLFPVAPLGAVVARRARGSRRRLGVDALDLYQVHWPNPVFPIGPTMAAFARLQREGVVRHSGVSNFSRAKWEAADQALGQPVVSNQVRYNLLDRRAEREILPFAQANDRIVIAYSPLAQGLLSGNYDASHLPRGMRSSTTAFLPRNLEALAPLLDVLRQVAEAHDATCAQVALAWVVNRPNMVAIPGASSLAQAEFNAAAAEIELAADEDQALCVASDAYRPLRGPAAVPAVVRSRLERSTSRVGRTLSGLRA